MKPIGEPPAIAVYRSDGRRGQRARARVRSGAFATSSGRVSGLAARRRPRRDDSAGRVLQQGEPAATPSIADAVVTKAGGLFFLCQPDGRVPVRGTHGLGLYWNDCRFLNGYEMKIAGRPPEALLASAAAGYKAVFELTNPDLRVGGRRIHKQQLSIKWERVIDGHHHMLCDRITFTNFGDEDVDLPVELAFRTGFEPLFAVRGMRPRHRGRVCPVRWNGGVLSFRYDGADRIHRTLSVHFSQPVAARGRVARFRVALRPEQRHQLLAALAVAQSPRLSAVQSRRWRRPNLRLLERAYGRSDERWLSGQTVIRSERPYVQRVVRRSQRDLDLLRTRQGREEFFAAGVPWYVALFGRDSLLSALQTLSLDPRVGEHTLRLLARRQGRRVDPWRDEEPGKILHELRVGELARVGEIPQTPYYGSIDSTPLFLVLLAEHAAWTGTLDLFHSLRRNVEAALRWAAECARNGDGYLAYRSRSASGLINQGWKDSGDAIVNSDGTPARPPIALAEVQGYLYRAERGLADLYRRAGDERRAEELLAEAQSLRARFNRDFWLAENSIFAIALQGDGAPAAVVSSNAGQVLWSGIAEEAKARCTADRLMEPDMFSGWGVRTMSTKERRFNPVGYHLGTVWPHDNALIAAGLRRYRFDAAALRILSALLDAATHFEHERLPEVFAGFDRDEYELPVRYPVACHPQAWAAAAIPYLLASSIGLVPEAFEDRLRIVRPVLPQVASHLELHGLRVGSSRVALGFTRASDGTIDVDVLGREGPLEIVIERDPGPPG